MHMTVRRCTKCGREDLRERWESVDAAARAGAMSAAWACPACAWPEADLVEATTDATQTSTVPSATPPGTDPVLPAAPDESRWTVESTFPLRRP